MKSVFSKDLSIENGDCWNFTSSFVFFPIFLNNTFHGVICLVNTDSLFSLNCVTVWEFLF